MRPRRLIAAGIAATLALAALWHGPLGAGQRVAETLESQARATISAFEMAQVQVSAERHPLRRRLILAGPADSFQRGELARILAQERGVADVRWADGPRPFQLPLLGEAMLLALVGFALGLLIAYLFELRRRARRWDRF
jgi:hypothetical protein